MKTAIKAAAAAGLFILTLFPGCAQRQTDEANLRLLYWNIQNGMWSGQGDNYTRFVNWVSAQNPDVCVWCESVTNYKTASDEKIKPEEASVGHGLITVAEIDTPRPEARFTFKDKTIRLVLKPRYADRIRRDVKRGIELYGDLTEPYWQYVRALALRYWLDFDRHEIFDMYVGD